ncbi:MAG: class I SAM-dependent methyltransferase [Rhizobiales bacterium]|nr:class I SAM-dependent methyltransferase [Hyphomicrobiales bacterium]
MPVAEYMGLCLTHPRHGYYTTRDPFGRDGDFITAPEISQMFGELIGLWAASVWRQMGSPDNLRLVELGPGRGTMMLDMLRAAQVVPGFRGAIVAHLVEISPALERRQRQTLNGLDVPLLWHQRIEDVPDGPLIVVANEFFDALPAHQAVKQADGWHERAIGIDADGSLIFVTAPAPIPHFAGTLSRAVRDAPDDAVYEWRGHQAVFEIARRIVHDGGAALVVDYGHTESECGDTLQAVARHAYGDPLETPGLVDLTAHVDFQALATAAESIGASVHGPVPQRDLLLRLGIERRAAALKPKAAPEQADAIDGALRRLLDQGAGGMGRLFKAIAFAHPKLGVLPGFES